MPRWPILLAEALILQAVVLSNAQAAASAGQLLSAPAQPPADASAIGGMTDLYLGVTLNGSDRGIAHFVLRDDALWMSRSDLGLLGFSLTAETPDLVRLQSLKGVVIDYNQGLQSVSILAPLAILNLQIQTLTSGQTQTTHADATPGIVIDYTLYGSHQSQGDSNGSAYTDLRAFNRWGILESTALSELGYGSLAGSDQSVRLDTSWSTSFPGRLLTLRIGDTLTAATAWSRATRIGGIQFGTNFNLQPYLVTTPLAQFVGSATLPSQVQLYIDGMQRYTGTVAAGPFQLNSVANISGAGNAQMVLTNALGQVSNYSFSLYNAPQLLRRGLSDWSVELGAVRENYGLNSYDYGKQPVASETWRYGLTNGLTVESHSEATNGLADIGLGGDLLLGASGGILSASVTGSGGHGLSGLQVGAGYSWTNARFNVAASGLYATSHFSDVAARYGTVLPTLTATAAAGVNLGQIGSIGVNYVDLQQPQEPADSYAGFYWTKSLTPKVSLNLNASQNLGQQSDRSIFLTLNISLDSRTFASADVAHDGDGNAIGFTARRAVPTAGGLGWQTQEQTNSEGTSAAAEMDYLGRYGEVDAGVTHMNGEEAGYVGATGSLVLIGGHSFAARSIDGGFAVISTSGVPNVPVKLENNPVGTTDRDGMLLVTPLNAYQKNLISIDPMGLPANLDIRRVVATAIPSDRSGTLVTFDMTPVRAASLILVDKAGKPLPLGSVVTLKGSSGQPTLVGFDGLTYLEGLGLKNTVLVNTPSGECAVRFDDPARGSSIPQFGPLICLPIAIN